MNELELDAKSALKGKVSKGTSRFGYTVDTMSGRKVSVIKNADVLMGSQATINEFHKDVHQASWNYIKAYGVTQCRDLYWNGVSILRIAQQISQ